MGVLLIESSSKRIEFGYADNLEIVLNEKLDGNNADALPYFIKDAFEKYNISFKSIDIVSLSNGPGSFTGLRIGSAIAKGICFVNKSKLIEISSLDIIANKHKSENKIVSLIFSNSKTLEFYNCKYNYKSGMLNRISDYKIGILENILEEDADFVIDEPIDQNIDQLFNDRLINYSHQTNLISQFELTKNYIKENNFANVNNSQPFYMKEFIPKI